MPDDFRQTPVDFYELGLVIRGADQSRLTRVHALLNPDSSIITPPALLNNVSLPHEMHGK